MPNHDREIIDLARRIATQAHQKSKPYGGRPYIVHPAAVAKLLEPYGAEAVVAGWLHDTVEDTPLRLKHLHRLGFPKRVITAVDAVSRRPDETYFDFVRRAAQHDLGRIVKLADNFHNASGLDDAEDRLWAAGMKKRYRRARQILERSLVHATARLEGFVDIGGIRVCDLDESEGPYSFVAIGHHDRPALLTAFQKRARELEYPRLPDTADDITHGWGIWSGTVTAWSFTTVPDDTTPGAFRASWLNDY